MHLSSAERTSLVLFTGAAAVFLLLLVLDFELYPVVIADEYTNSIYARLVPFYEALYPNYLYFFFSA